MKKKSKAGRKTKLTQSVLKKIQAHKGECLTDRALANIVHVTPETFSHWRTKAATVRSGIFLQFLQVLHEDDAATDERILKPWMKEIDNGNIKAIELAMKRHPRLRTEFREGSLEIEQSGTFEVNVNFVPVRRGKSNESDEDQVIE